MWRHMAFRRTRLCAQASRQLERVLVRRTVLVNDGMFCPRLHASLSCFSIDRMTDASAFINKQNQLLHYRHERAPRQLRDQGARVTPPRYTAFGA